ncbi:MAG: hypothetical protein ACJARS_003497, partial [bacterium]
APREEINPRGQHGVSASADGTSSASVSVRLSATVVGTTSIRVSGAGETRITPGRRGTGFVNLGLVNSEGRRPLTGRVIERADDGGAFYVADLRAQTRFSGGIAGELHISSSGAVSDEVTFGFSCSRLSDNVFRRARTGVADGAYALDARSTSCDGDGREQTPVSLVLHVPDRARPGRMSATYVLTAAPELL